MEDAEHRADRLSKLTDADRQLVESGQAEWERRRRDIDYNHNLVIPEKAMGFPGDAILVRHGGPARQAPRPMDEDEGPGE